MKTTYRASELTIDDVLERLETALRAALTPGDRPFVPLDASTMDITFSRVVREVLTPLITREP
jgi:hypothetical protein